MTYKITQTEDEELLEIITKEGTELRGFCQLNNTDNPAMIVSDLFHIVRRVSSEAVEGGVRDVYEIDRRYQIVDRIPQIGQMNAVNFQGVLESEDALCDLDEQYAERIAEIEDALCEMDEREG